MLPKPPAGDFNFAGHLLALNCNHPERRAYVDDQGTLSYGDLAQQVQRMAAALQRLSLRREERVLLLMHDNNHWPVCFLGALYAGIVPVAVNTMLNADDYAYMLRHCRAQAVVVSGALMPVLMQALAASPNEVHSIVVSRPEGVLPAQAHDVEALIADGAVRQAVAAPTHFDDPAFWLYSSGSTGRPKGAVHTHGNAWWVSELYGRGVLALKPDDVCFSAAKLYFAYGLGNALMFPLTVGASVVLFAGRPTPEAVFERWTRHRVSVFFGAPTGYAGLLASSALPSREMLSMRLFSSAGEALPPELGRRIQAHFGCEVLDGIGSTEMLHIFLSNRPGDVRFGTTGKPVPGYELGLRGDDGRPVMAGDVGDLYIKGPSAAMLYWRNGDKSRDTFQGAWTKSGDKYSVDADGYYICAGRSDDMLKVSGIYVSPVEVEATLVQHPAVLEAAVIGVVDAQGLTKTKAFVVLKPGAAATEDELKAFVKDRLAPYKYPRQIDFVSDLPKTATGKIQRFVLRNRESAG